MGEPRRGWAWTRVEQGDLPEAIARQHADGTTVTSVCTGRMLLAVADLTDGRPAVPYHGALDDLRESGAEVTDACIVDDGDVVTAGRITAVAISRLTWSSGSSVRAWPSAWQPRWNTSFGGEVDTGWPPGSLVPVAYCPARVTLRFSQWGLIRLGPTLREMGRFRERRDRNLAQRDASS